MPEGWEMRYTNEGVRYFVDHNTRSTTFQVHFIHPFAIANNEFFSQRTSFFPLPRHASPHSIFISFFSLMLSSAFSLFLEMSPRTHFPNSPFLPFPFFFLLLLSPSFSSSFLLPPHRILVQALPRDLKELSAFRLPTSEALDGNWDNSVICANLIPSRVTSRSACLDR